MIKQPKQTLWHRMMAKKLAQEREALDDNISEERKQELKKLLASLKRPINPKQS